MDEDKQGEQKKRGRCGAVAFPNVGESAAALPCCISSAMRGLTFLAGTWGWGRTRPDTKTAGLSPQWHPSHLSHPKPRTPACGLSTPREAIPAYPGPRRGAGALQKFVALSLGFSLVCSEHSLSSLKVEKAYPTVEPLNSALGDLVSPNAAAG